MENATPTTCPYEGESEVRSLYLAGNLPEAEAQAFEEHYFACERCAEAQEVGTKLRSAFGKSAVRLAAIPMRPSRPWIPLAAAAAVAFLAVGVWQIARRPVESSPSVLRSGTAFPLEVRVEADPQGPLHLSWTPLPEAARYVVRVLKPDGASVWNGESREPRITIDPSTLSTRDAPLDVQVEAMDAMERVVATSEPKPLIPR